MKKKTVLIHSNFCRAFTGFGKNKKNLLRYLYDTGKYNMVCTRNNNFSNRGQKLKMRVVRQVKDEPKDEPKVAAQPADDEDIDNYMAAFDAKMEESLKKLENLIRNKKRSGASESEIKKAIQAYKDNSDAFFLNEQLKKSDK